MLTPLDKVRKPGGNDIIQIEITRACNVHTCSNCTRLLPFRRDTKHMSLDVFRSALRSLEGWPGIRALFGGNPCSHPRFDDICAILIQEVPDQRKRGLWTNDLLGKGEIARKTFWPDGRFNLNVHHVGKAAAEMRQWLPGIRIVGESGPVMHSPILMDRRDYGMSDADWIAARENCDINQKWSAAIVERDNKPYAYFCEVAAAIDGIRDTNYGVEAVPGWWRMPMAYYHEQVVKCCDEGCGVPLRRKGSPDTADTYDVSPSWSLYKDSRVRTEIHELLPASTHEATDYVNLRGPK